MRLNRTINWDKKSQDEGFKSLKEMIQHYIIRNGTFKGAAIDLDINIETLRRIRIFLHIHQFKPYDYYAWTKGYDSMHELVKHKMREGYDSRRITDFVEGYVNRETIKLIMRKVHDRHSSTLRNLKRYGRCVARSYSQ